MNKPMVIKTSDCKFLTGSSEYFIRLRNGREVFTKNTFRAQQYTSMINSIIFDNCNRPLTEKTISEFENYDLSNPVEYIMAKGLSNDHNHITAKQTNGKWKLTFRSREVLGKYTAHIIEMYLKPKFKTENYTIHNKKRPTIIPCDIEWSEAYRKEYKHYISINISEV